MERNVDPEVFQFGDFLKNIGFKRVEGTIFGLLTLSPAPLSSEEISERLNISQAAVSQAIKSLTHWGAVESAYSPERRVHLHSAVEDSLSIVADVFTKREQGSVAAFKRANLAARDRFLSGGAKSNEPHLKRLESNILTCEFGETVMNFVIALSRLGMQRQYAHIVRLLPKAFSLLLEEPKIALGIKDRLLKLKEKTQWL